jgi:endonuclease V-like protein UPF0215 family
MKRLFIVIVLATITMFLATSCSSKSGPEVMKFRRTMSELHKDHGHYGKLANGIDQISATRIARDCYNRHELSDPVRRAEIIHSIMYKE